MLVLDTIKATTQSVLAWLRERFGLKAALEVETTPEPVVPLEPAVAAPAVSKKPVVATPDDDGASPAARKRAKGRGETFAELLDGLEDAFESCKIPTMRGSWLPRKDIRALHKLGVFVPHPWLMEWFSTGPVVVNCSLPAIASAFFMHSKFDDKDKVHPRFAFAIKADRLPPGVELYAGTAYRFGVSYELKAEQFVEDSPARMFWAYCWVVVSPDGVVVVPNELHNVSETITRRRVRTGESRRESVHLRQWGMPTMMKADPDQDQDDFVRYMKLMFRQLLVWWSGRADRWSVAATRSGQRLTFSIDSKDTPSYFADRDKTAKAPDGSAKKIIHFVREHVRSNGSTVRAHVRGLRIFDWNGCRCTVTAPRLTGNVVSALFTLPPVEVDPGDRDTLDVVQVAEILVAHEDADVRVR